MNHFKLFAASALVILSTSSACAADYVYVTKDNVNLRNGASSQSKIVGKARLGMVVRPLAAEGDWTKVQSLDGTTMYVSSQYLKDLPDGELSTDYFLFTPQQKEDAQYNIGYGASESDGKSETSTTWILMAEPDNEKVMAEMTWQYADISGRMNSVENYYTGKRRGWYVELTHQTDYEYANPTPLEKSIFVYQPYSPTSAIYVNGEYFENYENAFDEEWGD